MRRFIFSLVMLAVFCQHGLAQQPTFVSNDIDAYIQKGLKDWNIPGLAIVIVKDGQVVLRKGYGVRDIETKEPVDENTLFMIASNSKLFTGLALAQLEQRRKLSLNDRIQKYFPEYKLYDSTTTRLVTIRDMLSHRIGTKTFQGDFTFWNSALSRMDIMNKMRLLKPAGEFRQDYGYCNSCFLVAGEVIPRVTGISWEQYIQDSILTPLEMTRSTAISAGMESKQNVARPYTTSYTGTLKRVPYDQWDNLGPAASIISNVKDLTNWLQFQLDSGKYLKKSIMTFSVLQKTRDVNIVTSSRKSGIYPMHFRGYGLGVFSADYNGRQIFWHTGGAGGMVSNVCFVPEANLGIAVLTNNDNQSFFEALRYQVLDAYLGVNGGNRSEQSLGGFNRSMKNQLQEIANWRARVKGNQPGLSLNEYVGNYTHEIYGSLNIQLRDNRLVLRFNGHKNMTATLDYMDNDEWLLEYENVEYGIHAVRFGIAAQKVNSLQVKVNEFIELDAYTFKKIE